MVLPKFAPDMREYEDKTVWGWGLINAYRIMGTLKA